MFTAHQSSQRGAVQALEGVSGRVGGDCAGLGVGVLAGDVLHGDGRGLRASVHHSDLPSPHVIHILVQLY